MNVCGTILARTLSIALLAFATATAAYAQKSYSIEAPVRDTTLAIRGYFDFPVLVTNTSSSPATIYVNRIQNELPSLEWISYICSRDLCFPPERNNADPVGIGPGAKADYHFSVSCGSTPGEVGRFALEVSDGSTTDTLRFTVTVAQGADVDQPTVTVSGPLNAWPSPALDVVNIPMPAQTGLDVSVMSSQGTLVSRLVSDGSPSMSLDIRALPSGVYFYQIAGKRSGSFVVAR